MLYDNIPLSRNTTEHRFELNIDEGYAFIDYKQAGNTIYLVHTEVADALQGNGIAAALVEKTFKYLEEHHLKMIPGCSFVQYYLHRHPEWNRLVTEE